jgi:8-oxo-dGTP diphosphatase
MPEHAAAVVVHEARVLLVRRSTTEGFLPGRWGVPCGKLDHDETAERAVLRELFEETGLNGSVTRFVGRSDFTSVWHGRRVNNVQRNYLVRPDVDSVRLDPDGMPHVTMPKDDQIAKWVPADAIEGFGLDQHNLRTIQQGLEVASGLQPASSVISASSSRR